MPDIEGGEPIPGEPAEAGEPGEPGEVGEGGEQILFLVGFNLMNNSRAIFKLKAWWKVALSPMEMEKLF